MGRRALRKIDPNLDLEGILFPAESVTEPFRAEAWFGRVAPLEIEVGSGKGLFLQTAAAARPDHDFLGFEIVKKYAAFCAARMRRHALTNARMICGDAVRFFRDWLPDACAVAVHVYFPDPWWKKRHWKRRVMNEGFASEISRVLQPGGQLHFWTDVEEYYQLTLELLAGQRELTGPFPEEPRVAEHDLDYRTHFERRCRLGDEAVYRAIFRRETAR